VRWPVAGLTTRGRCLIAAGVACGACAVVLDERDLLRVAALLIALPVLSALLCGWSILRVQVTRTVRPRPIAVGDHPGVELALRARFRTPLAGLLLRDLVPPSCGHDAQLMLGRLRAGTTASVHYSLAPRMRGAQLLGPLQVCVADPLGLTALVRTVGEPTAVLVRPRVEHLTDGAAARAVGAEHGRPQRTLAPTVRDAQLRIYTPGDDTRSIHWPSTARRGELMVRTAEHGHGAGMALLLDTRRSAHTGEGERSSLEQAVSLIASMAVHLHSTGIPTRVLTTEGEVLAAGEAGMDELALITPSDRADFGAVLRQLGGDGLIAVLGDLDMRTAAALLDRGGRAPSAAAVQLQPGTGADALRSAGWTVLQCERRTSAAQLWSALGQRDTRR